LSAYVLFPGIQRIGINNCYLNESQEKIKKSVT